MAFIKFFFSISAKDTFYILVISIINGICGGLLIILYPNAALDTFLHRDISRYFIILPLTTIVFVVTQRLSQQRTSYLVENALESMVLKILNTIRHDELPNFQQRDKIEIHRVIANMDTITQAGSRTIENIEHNLTLFIGWIYILFYLSAIVGIILIFWRLTFFIFVEAFSKMMVSAASNELKQQTKIFSIFQHILQGFKELKFNHKKNQDMYENYLLPHVHEIEKLRIQSRLHLVELLITYTCSLYAIMGGAAFIFFSHFATGAAFKTVIMLIFLMRTDLMIFPSIPMIAEGIAALGRFQKLFAKTHLKEEHQNIYNKAYESANQFKLITLNNVGFTYPLIHGESGFSIEIDHLTIKAGEILFVIGGNGSGKSTLLLVLAGLYNPNKGEIKIDGMPVQMSDYRGLFSVIFSDFYMFDRLFGLDKPDLQKIHKLLKMTELNEKISYRDGRFSPIDISTGQKKRLSLIMAMMEDKPIYLFDEWAAEQDPDFRKYFYEELLPMLKREGKTVIVITHDDRFFYMADSVVRMEYGKIIERFDQSNPVKPASVLPQKDKPVRLLFKSKQDKQEKSEELKSKNFLKQMLEADNIAVKKTLWFMIIASFCMVGMSISILSAVRSPSDVLNTFLFIPFIIQMLLFTVTYRRMSNVFYKSSEERISKLRINVTDKIRKTSLQTLEQIGAGKIYTVLSSDIKSISDASNIMLQCLFGAFRVVMSYIYIGYLYIPAFIMLVLSTFIGAGFYIYNQSFIISLFEQIRNQEKNVLMAINGLFYGFKELRINAKKSDDFYRNSVMSHVSMLKDMKVKYTKYYINNHTIAYIFWQGVLLTVTLVMPFIGLPVDVLPILVGLLTMMPIRQIIDRYSQFYMAYMSINRLYQFEDTLKNLIKEPDATANPEELSGYKEIRYEQLSFIYKAEEKYPFSIGPLDLSLKPGRIVFITGGNGSGKSTLLKVLTGLYQQDSGKIFFNDKEIDIRSYRELFYAIFNDFHLFDRFYGMKDPDTEKLKNLFKQFQLEDKLKWIDGQFSTLDLSTGQKKRLALIVALMENKPIYVFDEWAAEQDPLFRDYFYKTLLPEFKAQNKTVIAVTHDDRYFHIADEIIHMEYGQVVN